MFCKTGGITGAAVLLSGVEIGAILLGVDATVLLEVAIEVVIVLE